MLLMAKTRITITLDPDIEEWLKAGAMSGNKSLSEVVRLCLREYSAAHPTRFLRTDKARLKSEAPWMRKE